MSNEHQEYHEFHNQDETKTSYNQASIGGATASASTTSNGGAGGAGGAGGQALNITYVDNYSMFMLLYTLILMLIDDKNNERQGASTNYLLPLLKSIMEEQREYRKAFLEAIQLLKP